MCNSQSVNDFINLDNNVYMDDDDINVLIDDQSTNQSDSEDEGNEGNNEKNDEENQLKTYKEAIIYIKSLEQFSINKYDSE
jgi:hypothetical protein